MQELNGNKMEKQLMKLSKMDLLKNQILDGMVDDELKIM